MKTEPRKATHARARHKLQNLDPAGVFFPAAYHEDSGLSLGNLAVELAPPNGTNNLTGGTNKNELRV